MRFRILSGGGVLRSILILILIPLLLLLLLLLLIPSHMTKDQNTNFLRVLGLNNIRVDPRGFWSGTDTTNYHASHHPVGLTHKLVTFFRREGGSVIDLGGGSGLVVKTLIAHGIFASCFDGNPNAQDGSEGVCGTVDLTKPLRLAQYDWVLSLSVGRQIPPQYEHVFVDNIRRLARRGVIIYWGDGRPTTQVRTVRNNSQVIATFTGLGFDFDPEGQRSLIGNSSSRTFSLLVFRNSKKRRDRDEGRMVHLVIVACGTTKEEEAVTLVKSAILFTQDRRCHVYLFRDRDNATSSFLEKEMRRLWKDSGHAFTYSIHPTSFPPDIPGMVPWTQVFKPCSLQRLFLPSALPDVDSVIYMDADTLILSNLTELWGQFEVMNDSQVIGLSPLTQSQNNSWFIQRNLPHYGETGLNCGIALMNLTRMRSIGFEEMILRVRKDYEEMRPAESGDQFLQNVLYSVHPELVYVMGCEWNLRPLHCNCGERDVCGCRSGLREGVGVIHGTADAFTHKRRLPLFRHIYEIIKVHSLKDDSFSSLLEKLKDQFQMELTEHSNTCFFNSSITFYKKFQDYVTQLERS